MSSFTPALLRGSAEMAPVWAYAGELFAAQSLTYANLQTEPTTLELGCWNLIAMQAGTWLIGRRVLTARHLALVPPGKHVIAAVAGPSAALIVHWHSRALPWLDAFLGQRLPQGLRVAPGTFELLDRPASATTDLRMISILLERVSDVLESQRSIWLRPQPSAEPTAFSDLLQSLEQAPTKTWHLQDAADAAGYSPFHFSRTFKQVVGCGFHEYLDRLRTELALEQLCAGVAVSEAATSAGFSSTRSLRESLKDYLGLMPSDLRCAN